MPVMLPRKPHVRLMHDTPEVAHNGPQTGINWNLLAGCFENSPDCAQARKKSTKIKFLGPETARWSGGLPLEVVVAENFVPALQTLSSLGFEERNPGCPGNFAGMSRTPGGVQKVCAKKLREHFSFPMCIKRKDLHRALGQYGAWQFLGFA